MKSIAVFALILVLAACSPSDKRSAEHDLHRGGEAVKKELKNDAAFVKQEALKAREETQKGVKKLKEKTREERERHDDAPPPDSNR